MNIKTFFFISLCCWIGKGLSAQNMLVKNLSGSITKNEIGSFKAFVGHMQPSRDNIGNDWVYGSSGSTMEALGMMYETTHDTSILNQMVHFADVALHIRNHPDTGRILWTGKKEMCWPNKAVTAEDAGYSGSENGDVIAHIAYCAKLIIQDKNLWYRPVSIGDAYQFGSTYIARAKKYIAELDRTIDHYILPNFIQNKTYRFYWPQNEKWQTLGARYKKDSGKPIPWNQQAMLAGGFQRLAECHELLNEQVPRVALYDSIVKAYSDWFISQLNPYDVEGHTCYKWSYAVNDSALKYMEDQGHGGYDVWGICRAYDRKVYGIGNEIMEQLANTILYVMYKGNGLFSKKVDGSNGTQNYLGASYMHLTRFRPELYDIIASANLEPAKTKPNYFAQTIFTRQQLVSAGAQKKTEFKYSQLWGKNGELWDTTKIPDFTNSGYKQGKKTIPVYTSQIDVTKLGAIGDGKTDNTPAFRAAIKQCRKNQAVYIPAGTYLLTDSLVISKSNICIRGEGAGKTKLFFSKGLEELYPDYNVHYKNQTQWSWGGAMILFDGNISDCGIENLSVEFPDSVWAGHNFHERAYDGVGFANGAHDGWIRNVAFINADMGIWIERSAHHITAEGWVLDFGPNRKAQNISGHHGVNIYGGHNLLQDFELKGKYQHDLSVESEYSVYNVFRGGRGTDLCIDHHNHAQSRNLFTNIDAGIGSRIYASGGNDTPRGICTHETFWNIRAEKTMPFCNQHDTKEKHSTNNVCVGVKTSLSSQLNDVYGNWFEAIDPLQLYPADLYKAQMEWKKSKR